MSVVAASLEPVAGFEQSPWRWAGARLVYAGTARRTRHPREWPTPWQPPVWRGDAAALRHGARLCAAMVGEGRAIAPRGLLRWSCGLGLEHPLQQAVARFDALRGAMTSKDLPALEAAALRVLGLGPGLTPSGDDFLGGLGFGLHHAAPAGWAGAWPLVAQRLAATATQRTHVISAALLADLLAGRGYSVLHDLLQALQRGERAAIEARALALLSLGASSGADLLAGLLLALAPESLPIAA